VSASTSGWRWLASRCWPARRLTLRQRLANRPSPRSSTPALRSPLATPTVQLAAEVGDDSKYATGKVGAAAFVTRDFWDNAWGLELPVYFMARPDGGFTGGLVLTYNGAR